MLEESEHNVGEGSKAGNEEQEDVNMNLKIVNRSLTTKRKIISDPYALDFSSRVVQSVCSGRTLIRIGLALNALL